MVKIAKEYVKAEVVSSVGSFFFFWKNSKKDLEEFLGITGFGEKCDHLLIKEVYGRIEWPREQVLGLAYLILLLIFITYQLCELGQKCNLCMPPNLHIW